MKYIFVALHVFLYTCTTSQPENIGNYDECYCGTVMKDGKNICAVWEKSLDLSKAKEIAFSVPGACEPKFCEESLNFCGKVTSWDKASPQLKLSKADEACFCDEVVISLDNRTFQVCASWRNTDDNLIEYYLLDKCTPESCKKEPFHKSAALCPSGFAKFYPNDSTVHN